jgi:hypothetical protein
VYYSIPFSKDSLGPFVIVAIYLNFLVRTFQDGLRRRRLPALHVRLPQPALLRRPISGHVSGQPDRPQRPVPQQRPLLRLRG